jgi:ADP-heptose:LPS heptosyltransferase
MHEVERGLDLVGGLGVPPAGRDLVLRPRVDDRTTMAEFVATLGRQNRPVVAIHPGCSCPARTYPADRFALLADAVQEELGARVVWTGSAAEVGLIERIQSTMKRPGLSLAGQTDLSRLAALLAASDVAITSNTGPMHLAAAVKTPVVALFALTNPPHEWRPWAVAHRLLNRPVSCEICYHRVCPFHQECLRDVPIADGVQAVADLLTEREKPVVMQHVEAMAVPEAYEVPSEGTSNVAKEEERLAEWR